MSAVTEFLAPGSIEEAVAILGADGDAVPVGGATALSPMMREGLLAPSRLVWLGRVPDWGEIAEGSTGVRIAAGTTLAAIAASATIHRLLPALAAAAGVAANPRVRAVATIGGHLAHADPRQDLTPVLLAAGAVCVVAGPGGERRVPLDELLVGFYETSLLAGEVITSVEVPADTVARQVYARFNPASEDDYPTIGIAVQLEVEPGGTVAGARLAAGGCAGRATLLEHTAAAIRRLPASDVDLAAVEAAAANEIPVVGDHRGTERYKRLVAGVWARRAVAAAIVGRGPLLGRYSVV
jgi:carbon-monoxide dehydrogenase medium subunit